MAKPISFKDISVEAPWEIERMVYEQVLMDEAREETALPEDYLEQTVYEEQPKTKARRFGHGSTAEGPDEIQFVH